MDNEDTDILQQYFRLNIADKAGLAWTIFGSMFMALRLLGAHLITAFLLDSYAIVNIVLMVTTLVLRVLLVSDRVEWSKDVQKSSLNHFFHYCLVFVAYLPWAMLNVFLMFFM